MKKNGAPEPDHKVISYQKLRTFIGFTGIMLPILAVLGCLVTGAGSASFQHSISHYYYSKMHIVFVAVLCMLGSFLVTYNGKNKWECRLSNVAGYLAIGIAAFPTAFDGFQFNETSGNWYLALRRPVDSGWGAVHFVFAGLLFCCFIIFCLKFFQAPDDKYTGMEAVKFARRQLIYKICGWTIAASIVMIALFNFVIKAKTGLFVYSTFIFETTSLWAFGFAWLVKGSALWKDVPVAKNAVKGFR